MTSVGPEHTVCTPSRASGRLVSTLDDPFPLRILRYLRSC